MQFQIQRRDSLTKPWYPDSDWVENYDTLGPQLTALFSSWMELTNRVGIPNIDGAKLFSTAVRVIVKDENGEKEIEMTVHSMPTIDGQHSITRH